MNQITYEAKLGDGGNRLFPMPIGSIDALLVGVGMPLNTPVAIEVQGKQGQEQVLFEGHVTKAPPFLMERGLIITYNRWPADKLGPRGYQEGDDVYVTVKKSQP